MRRVGAALLLVLCVGCATPDRHHDLRTPDPVRATQGDEAFACLMQVIYCLGVWLGPKT